MGAGAAIGAAISAIAPVAISVTKVLATVGLAIEGIKGIGNVLNVLAKKEDIEEEDIADLGNRALQSGIDPNKFDDFNDYVSELKNFQLDPEKSNAISMEDKYNAGIGVMAGKLEEKIPGICDLITELGKNMAVYEKSEGKEGYMSPERLAQMPDLIENHKDMLSDISSFVKGEIKDAEKHEKIVGILSTEVEQKVDANISEVEAIRNISKLAK